MRTVLHIGMPKTGSTVLQDTLRASHEVLAAKGVLYPDNPPDCPFNNHRMLLVGFLPHRDLPRHVRKYPRYAPGTLGANYAAFLNQLRREVDEAGPAATILSSESLFPPCPRAAGRAAAGERTRPPAPRRWT